jgi:filamentous hemagglutinin
MLTPLTLGALDPDHEPLTSDQTAFATAASMLFGGTIAGLLGQNSSAAAMAAANEALNNATKDWEKEEQVHEHTLTHNIVPQSGGAIDEEEAGSTGKDLTVGRGVPVGAAATNTAAEGSNVGWTNTTIGRSIPNAAIELTRDQFEHSLMDAGFAATPRGGANDVTVYTNGNIQYTVWNNASSTGGPSVDYRVNGNLVSKIRLNGQ